MNTDSTHELNAQASSTHGVLNQLGVWSAYSISDIYTHPTRRTRRAAKRRFGNKDFQEKPIEVLEGKKSLYLMVNSSCDMHCTECVRKPLSNCGIIDNFDYDYIYIIGGEPLLSNKTYSNTISIIRGIKEIWRMTGHEGYIFVCTHSLRRDLLRKVLGFADGLIYYMSDQKRYNMFGYFYNNVDFKYKARNKYLKCIMPEDIEIERKQVLLGSVNASMWKFEHNTIMCEHLKDKNVKRVKNLL